MANAATAAVFTRTRLGPRMILWSYPPSRSATYLLACVGNPAACPAATVGVDAEPTAIPRQTTRLTTRFAVLAECIADFDTKVAGCRFDLCMPEQQLNCP